jgi:phosphoribosylanthranilate isomerase
MSDIKLKICGVRSVAEARQLRDLQVDYAGINFIPSSSRYIASIEVAEPILDEFKNSGIKTVGLFAGRTAEEVNDYARSLSLDYVQLHGNEPAEYAQQIDVPVMRAIAVAPDQSAGNIITFIDTYPADYFVLDRQIQGQGDLVDIELAEQVIAAKPGKVFLAGGLTPDNLAAILAQVQPYGIDIAGGVRIPDNNLDSAKVTQCVQLMNR